MLQEQAMLIEDSLQRLERSVFTAPVGSTGEGQIRAQEAQMVLQFAERARRIEPQGKVIVADEEGNEIALSKGDMFAIPAGFSGVWTTIETVKKLYVIYEK